MKVGYCEIDISPPDGSPMCAFPKGPENPRLSNGIHDSLKARVLVFANDTITIALVSCDLLAWQTIDVLDIKQKTKNLSKGKILAQNIIISCTHTHSSFENTYLFGAKPNDPIIEDIKNKISQTICKALENMSETKILFSQVMAPFNHNRRQIKNGVSDPQLIFNRNENSTGISDPTLSLLKFELSNKKTFFWLNWTAHALTLNAENMLFTADYPGAFIDTISKSIPNSFAIFTNGCAGNIHPYKSMSSKYSIMYDIANNLKNKFDLANKTAKPLSNEHLHFEYCELPFKYRADDTIILKLPIGCLTIGNIKIGFLPGEPFVEFQLDYRKAMLPNYSFVNGYSNGWTGYIPTKQAFKEGGYGATLFTGDPSAEFSRTQINPGDGEIMLKKLIEISKN